jgi:hypothetical protein
LVADSNAVATLVAQGVVRDLTVALIFLTGLFSAVWAFRLAAPRMAGRPRRVMAFAMISVVVWFSTCSFVSGQPARSCKIEIVRPLDQAIVVGDRTEVEGTAESAFATVYVLVRTEEGRFWIQQPATVDSLGKWVATVALGDREEGLGGHFVLIAYANLDNSWVSWLKGTRLQPGPVDEAPRLSNKSNLVRVQRIE